MKTTLEIGLSYTHRLSVTRAHSVPALLPESAEFRAMPEVLATGFMVGVFEWACMELLLPHLDPGEGSLGTHVDLSHVAATPPGFTLELVATLTEVQGRSLRFSVRGHDGVDLIGEGTHRRAIVTWDRFAARMAAKADRASGGASPGGRRSVGGAVSAPVTSRPRRLSQYALGGAALGLGLQLACAGGAIEPLGGGWALGLCVPLLIGALVLFGRRNPAQRPSGVTGAPVEGANRSPSSLLAPGARIGNYQLVAKIGSGGMGDVWLARHRRVARHAAVKLVRSDCWQQDDEEKQLLSRRFEREAQATALLSSPHTITLYDFGVTPSGDLYYAMELLSGFNLETLVRKYGPLPPARSAHLLAQICASLAEAHDRGLVHRDIKPANVFACRYGLSADFVKVLDFGLVKGADPLCGASIITRDGDVAGTLDYMAPEQISGEHPVGPALDIYAWGCVAYFLLTGRCVFEGPTPIAVALDQLAAAPRPPSCRAPYPVPAALDQLVLECLAKDPGARPADMQTIARRLAGISFAEPWSAAHADAWWREHVEGLAPMAPVQSAIHALTHVKASAAANAVPRS